MTITFAENIWLTADEFSSMNTTQRLKHWDTYGRSIEHIINFVDDEYGGDYGLDILWMQALQQQCLIPDEFITVDRFYMRTFIKQMELTKEQSDEINLFVMQDFYLTGRYHLEFVALDLKDKSDMAILQAIGDL